MGLDMYLDGTVVFLDRTEAERKSKPIGEIYRLGYWRKHPDVHGYIVEYFGDGEDDCRAIELNISDMLQIIEAIKNDKLPPTDGFFFGESVNDATEKSEAIQIFKNAIKWCEQARECERRSVSYRASW